MSTPTGYWTFLLMRRISKKQATFTQKTHYPKHEATLEKAVQMYNTPKNYLINFEQLEKDKKEKARLEMKVKRGDIGKNPWFAEKQTDKLKA